MTKDVSRNYLDRQRRENWLGFFHPRRRKLGDRVQLVGSARVDYVPYLEQLVPSPRGSFIFKPTKLSAIRLSGSTAFRAPSFYEAYLDLFVTSESANGAGSFSETARSDQGGDFRLKRERVVSFDLGYLSQDFDLVNFEVTGYFLQVKDLIVLSETRPETLSSNGVLGLIPTSGAFGAAFAGFENQCLTYNSFGSEAGARIFPVEGVDVFANYTFNYQKEDRPSGCNAVANQQTSKHKVNAGVQVRSKPGFDGELVFHYASPQRWTERVAPTDGTTQLLNATFDLPSYTLINARLGYRFLKNAAEVSGTVFNLGGQRFQQHPFGQYLDRRFMGFFSYRF
ncbi:MAG: TonB-dependent receptor [Polyangiaceae bacterium]